MTKRRRPSVQRKARKITCIQDVLDSEEGVPHYDVRNRSGHQVMCLRNCPKPYFRSTLGSCFLATRFDLWLFGSIIWTVIAIGCVNCLPEIVDLVLCVLMGLFKRMLIMLYTICFLGPRLDHTYWNLMLISHFVNCFLERWYRSLV